ncbi:HD domain-containing protein [Sphingomonas sp. DC1600-2]|uniref:HD domain-containing protein n=1 Tax=unclassified Sphingomonas TaxID=196159 RepID=UPI003CE77BCB
MPSALIDRIYALFAEHGDDRYGEEVDQLQHVLQAAQAAREDGASDTLIAAALLHDIGQFVDGAGLAADLHGADARHEELGAALLATAFPPAVYEPVRLHVAAKRYLCAVEPSYEAGLSAASALSLRLQGGAFDAAGIAAFEQEPYFADAVALRRYDDIGKQPDWQVPDLASYRPLLERLAVRPLA